jgi:hypothetical protein
MRRRILPSSSYGLARFLGDLDAVMVDDGQVGPTAPPPPHRTDPGLQSIRHNYFVLNEEGRDRRSSPR